MKTTVICRVFKDEGSAEGMKERLYRAGFPRYVMSVITPADEARRGGVLGKIEEALVPSDAAKAYASQVADGASLVVVRATYKPLNAVRIATEAFESSGALPSGLETDRFVVKTPPDPTPNILKDHPRFLTLPPSEKSDRRLLSERLGLTLLSPPKRRDSVMQAPKRFFGEGLIRKERTVKTLAPGSFMSQKFWPRPLLSTSDRPLSVISGGGHPFSRLFNWPLLSDRKPSR